MLRNKIIRFISHTIDPNSEYYLEKYSDVLKEFYRLSYPQQKGFCTESGALDYQLEQIITIIYHLSSLGIGSYIGAPDVIDDIKLFGAINESVKSGGVNVIDTAINYRYMKSERVIGAALRYLNYPREQLFISSKNGYIPADGDRGISEIQLIEQLVQQKLITNDDVVANCHCMHPAFLKHQLDSSLNNLGLETLDLLYLHNAAESQLPIIGYQAFYDRIKRVFQFFEEQVQLGKIKQYGLATYVCFRASPAEIKIHLNLEKIVKLAEEVAGPNHHFRYVQMPINVGMPEAFLEDWQRYKEEQTQILSVARFLKINLVISSPLMGGTMTQVPMPDSLRCQYLGAKHIQFVRSIPAEAIKTILVGQKANRHTKQNLEVIHTQPLSPDEFWELLRPSKRKQQPEDELDN
ncbi:hypothetical protein pb186bvf_016360 [Paramecium bursaria]